MKKLKKTLYGKGTPLDACFDMLHMRKLALGHQAHNTKDSSELSLKNIARILGLRVSGRTHRDFRLGSYILYGVGLALAVAYFVYYLLGLQVDKSGRLLHEGAAVGREVPEDRRKAPHLWLGAARAQACDKKMPLK